MIPRPGPVRAFLLLCCCSLLVSLPRPTQAQGRALVQVAGLIDVYAGFPVVGALLERSTVDRAGGGVAADRAVVADRAWKVPARAPLALPTPTLALFVPEYLASSEAVSAPSVAAPTVLASTAGVVLARSETTYYDVGGTSWADVAAALRQKGPRIRGSRFFGLTEWQVSVEYRPAGEGERCAIRDLTVHVEVETHLPRWTPSIEATTELRRAWERFIVALDEHEHGHRALATEAAEAIRLQLAAVQAPACDDLDPVAQRTMMAVMSTYESHNMAYDAETGHGRTQGAIWPPSP